MWASHFGVAFIDELRCSIANFVWGSSMRSLLRPGSSFENAAFVSSTPSGCQDFFRGQVSMLDHVRCWLHLRTAVCCFIVPFVLGYGQARICVVYFVCIHKPLKPGKVGGRRHLGAPPGRRVGRCRELCRLTKLLHFPAVDMYACRHMNLPPEIKLAV